MSLSPASLKKFAALLLGVSLLAGAPAHAKSDGDPLEPVNRAVFGFNQAADTYIIRPVVWGYRKATPQVVRTHIGNVTDNLMEPVNAVNSLLQGDFEQGVKSFWRFVINSTIGIAGINDVATEAGIKRRVEDFGQTLATWGVGSGPYIVLPLIGPSNLRDTGGMVADIFTNPINYYVDREGTIGIAVGQAVVARERLFETIDQINGSALDPYSTYRSIYQQRRAAQIANKFRDDTRTLSPQ